MVCSLVTLPEPGPSQGARQGSCIYMSPGVPWGIWSPLRGTVARDWRAPWDLVCTCGTLLQWHYRFQLVPANKRGLRKFWGRHSNAQGFQRHKADPEQGPHLPGSKSYTVIWVFLSTQKFCFWLQKNQYLCVIEYLQIIKKFLRIPLQNINHSFIHQLLLSSYSTPGIVLGAVNRTTYKVDIVPYLHEPYTLAGLQYFKLLNVFSHRQFIYMAQGQEVQKNAQWKNSFLGQWKYLAWYYDDGYMSLYISCSHYEDHLCRRYTCMSLEG